MNDVCWLCGGSGKIEGKGYTVTLGYNTSENPQVHEWPEAQICMMCGGTGKDLPFAPNISLLSASEEAKLLGK